MKTSEALEKIYLTTNENGTSYCTEGIPFEREYIEYIRKDVFIEKVEKWLKDNVCKYAKLKTLHIYADNYGTIARHFRGFNTTKLIEDLTKAMEIDN